MANRRVTVVGSISDIDDTAPTSAGSVAVGSVIVDYEDTSDTGDVMAAIDAAKVIIHRDMSD